MPESDQGAERLVVLLEARIAQFEKNMAKAERRGTQTYKRLRDDSKSATRMMEADMVRSTGRVNQALSAMSSQIGSLGMFAKGGGMLALLAVAVLGVAEAFKKSKEALQEFGDIADQSARAGLDPEFFQGITYGASLAGVSVEELSSALNTFSKNSGLAVAGKGKMVAALQKLNPALLENIRNAKTQEERVKLAADAIDQARDASAKAALATTLFGDAGAKLVPVFNGGASAIESTIAQARALGVVVDREMIARADAMGDEFDTLSSIIDKQLKQAFIDLAPSMIEALKIAAQVARAIAGIVDSWRALENQTTRGLNEQLTTIAAKRLDVEKQIVDAQKAQRDETAKMSDVAKNLGFADTQNPVLPGPGAISDLQKQNEELAKQQSLIEKILADRKTAAEASKPGTGADNGSGGDLPPLDPSSSSRNRSAEDALRQAQAVKDLIANLEFERSLIGRSETEQAKMNALRTAGAAATEEQKRQIEEIIDATAREQAAVEASAEALQLQKDIVSGALTDIRSALEDGKISWKEWGDIASNMISKVADKLQTDLVNALFSANSASSGTGLFGSIIGTLFGIGGGIAGGGGGGAFGLASGAAPAALPAALPAARPSVAQASGANVNVHISTSVDDDGKISQLVHRSEERAVSSAVKASKAGLENYRRNGLASDIAKRSADRRVR